MKRKSSGFTLLEMIIVLAITGIVMGIVTSIFMTGNKVFSNSDVKTTLQMDAKDIQERISDICMQATSIKSVTGNKDTGEITNLKINSYDNDESEEVFEIKKTGNKMEINGFNVPSDVISLKIDKEIVSEGNKKKGSFANFNSIKFDIELQGKERFSEEINYPVSFTVKLRNHD